MQKDALITTCGNIDVIKESKKDLEYFRKSFLEKTANLPKEDIVFLTPKTDDDKIKVYERYRELQIFDNRQVGFYASIHRKLAKCAETNS